MPLTKQQVAELRRPFVPEAIGFKVQQNPKDANGSALIVSFITSRDVVARLNAVAPGDWADLYTVPPVGSGLVCHLTVGGVTRCDVGHALKTDTDMGIKALYSDAFKRAGVKFEVGGFLYSLPQMWLKVNEGLKQYGNSWVLLEGGKKNLRARYEKWLKEYGKTMFGEPLDHGSHEDAQGDVETGETPGVVDEPKAEAAAPSTPGGELADVFRAALLGKKVTKYKDDKKWFALKASKSNRDLLLELKAEYEKAGGDASELKARWEAGRKQ